MTGFAGARNDEAFSRRVRTRVLLQEKRKAPDPIPSDGAGGGTGIHLDHARRMKSGRRNADRRVCPTSAPPPASSFACGGEDRGGGAARVQRDALACRRSTAALAAANQRRRSALERASWDAADIRPLPETGLSQSSELLADRSWCRPGVFPEPPENGSDEPPPAGTALAPAAGVTRRPSYKLSEIRDVRIRNRDKCQATVAISATAGSWRKAGAPQHRACYRFSRGEKRGVNDRRQGNRHFARRHRQDRDGESK